MSTWVVKSWQLAALVMVTSGCTWLLPTEAGEGLAHFSAQAPEVGQAAPDFELRDISGAPVRLSDLIGSRPIVLQLGSHTCPVYRYRRFGMRELKAEFDDRVHFLVVYTLEAHPTGSPSPYSEKEWRPLINRIASVDVPQHTSLVERVNQARESTRALDVPSRMLVDRMDNRIWETYGSAPSPAFVIDREGRIVLSQPWVDPPEIRDALMGLLLQGRLQSAIQP